MSLGRLHPPYCIHVVLDIMCFALPPPRRAYPVLSNPVQYEHAQVRTAAATAAAGRGAGGKEREQKGETA